MKKTGILDKTMEASTYLSLCLSEFEKADYVQRQNFQSEVSFYGSALAIEFSVDFDTLVNF